MPRPKKSDAERKDQRVTIYLSESEEALLKDASRHLQRSMTQVVNEALGDWLIRLIDPPESLRHERYEKIMQEKSLSVRGFICGRGHKWWVDWAEPMDPRRCPICDSERQIRRTWGGTVKRGL